MNVLFISDSTTVSGAELVLLGCVDALKATGHVPYGFMRDTNTRLIEAFRRRGVPFTATTRFSNRLIRTTANPLDLSTFARSFYGVTREMVDIIRTVGVDLIHSISYPASLYASFPAVRTGTPHVWHEHNIKRIHRVNRVIYRNVGRTCRWVIGPSDAVTNNLAKAGIDRTKLRTVYNGIDLDRFHHVRLDQVDAVRRGLGLRDGEQAVGLFGQLLPYKGHRTLIEAATRILRTHPRTRFYFVGARENPVYERELRAALTSTGLQERFQFTGWRSDVPLVIGSMDVVVVATVTPEPAALMLMEAMAMERPVVATCTGGTPEIVLDGETGLLFPPGDSERLASHVARLLTDQQFARTLATSGRARVVGHFSREHHLQTMFTLYAEAARRKAMNGAAHDRWAVLPDPCAAMIPPRSKREDVS